MFVWNNNKKKLFPPLLLILSPASQTWFAGRVEFFFHPMKKWTEIREQTEMKWNWTHGRNWGEERQRQRWRQDEPLRGLEIKTKILFRRQNTSVCQARTRRNCFSLVTYCDNIYMYVWARVRTRESVCARACVRMYTCTCLYANVLYFPRDQSKSVNEKSIETSAEILPLYIFFLLGQFFFFSLTLFESMNVDRSSLAVELFYIYIYIK